MILQKGLKMTILFILLILVLIGLVYIRFAPSDPERWHVMPDVVQDRTGAGDAARRITGGQDAFAKLVEIAMASERTSVLAGSLEEGMITCVTRSKVFGFPDYTTIALTENEILVLARLRFGRSDFGVNAGRVDAWIARLAADEVGTEAAR